MHIDASLDVGMRGPNKPAAFLSAPASEAILHLVG